MKIAHHTVPTLCLLFAALFLSACAAVTPPTGTMSDKTVAELRKSFDASLVKVNDALSGDQGLAVQTPTVSNFLHSGMALSDLQCKTYFKNLGLAAQHYAYSRKELGLTSGLVAGLQGLSGASAKVIAVTASMFSFGIASSEAYADVFLFSPDISGLQEMVESAQTTYRDAIPPLKKLTYGDAVGVLRDYDKLCEVQTIRRLINESVSTARFASGNDRGAVISAAERYAIARTLGESIVTTDQVIAMYWLVMGAPTAADKTVIARMLNGIPFFANPDGSLKTLSAQQLATVKGLLAQIVERNEEQLNKIIADLRDPATPSEDKSTPGASARRSSTSFPQGSISIKVQR